MLRLLPVPRALLAVAALIVVAACDRAAQSPRWDSEPRIPTVEAVEVLYGTLPLEERLAGSVTARNQTEIFPEIPGRIVEVLASDGDRVDAGTPLVRLRDTEIAERLQQAMAGLQVAEARVQQAEANLTRAQAVLRRMQAMAERNLGSAADLDTARADALSAEAQLALMQAEKQQAASLVEERRSELAATVVRAPTTGVVGGRNAEVGQLASTSTPLFVIGDPDQVRVQVTLTQRMLGYIDVGMPVIVVADGASGEPIEGGISRISPFLHPVTRTTEAEIDVERHGGALRPGMFVTVDVLYGESELAALVPNSAIYRHPRDGREGVFAASLSAPRRDIERQDSPDALAEGSPLDPSGPVAVQFVPVRVVARGRQSSAVGGVEPGDWVVTVGHHLLASSDIGQAVIQPTPWDHILRLQQMQTRDLLELIRRRQGEIDGEAEAAL